MKSFIFFVLIMIAVVGGAVEAVAENIEGEWRVISTNCPDVLAEKSGEKKTFKFKANRSMNYSHLLKECREMNGGTIIVEESGKYHFFSPSSNQGR